MSQGNVNTFPEHLENDRSPNETQNRNKFKENAVDIIYSVTDVPPIGKTIVLSIQQFLTITCSMVTIPFVIYPAICVGDSDPARAYIMSTMYFVSGIATIVQVLLGVRLPIIQGMSASFLVPILNVMALPQFQCPANATINGTTDPEVWQYRMRELQGSIAVSSSLQIFLSISGLLTVILRFITPLVVIPTITLIGFSIIQTAASASEGNWAISICTTLLLILTSQHLENVPIPYPTYKKGKGFKVGWISWFKFFPIITSIIIMWIVCLILTATNVFPENNTARTDSANTIINHTPWFKFPYPGQWGAPTTSAPAAIGMLTAGFTVIIESIGDYFACARLTNVPSPPPHAINRGILVEGFGCLIAGLFGSGSGTTTYAESIGAISITKVGCRRIILVAAGYMLIFGMMTKFTAVVASIPRPIMGGLMTVSFSLITGIGLSTAQYINLNSSRNIFILGFSIWFGIYLPGWVATHKDVIQTGNSVFDEVIVVILSTSMFIGGFTGFILDNTIPGSAADRGLTKWMKNDDESLREKRADLSLYDLPLGMSFFNKKSIFKYIPICPPFKQPKCGSSKSTVTSDDIETINI
ncbi:hypothetical protein CHUAL_008695 [Chamberlinius hualienensis]